MKKYIFTIIIALISGFCIFSPAQMIAAAKSGLSLWATIIIPSLFPFMILADLIQKTALPFIFNKLLNPIMKPIFNLPGISSIAIFLGMTGGYPVGAKITADMLNDNSININQANHLITFVNNSGPLFILGAIGIGIYKNIYVGILLLLSHYIGAIITGLLFRIHFNKKYVPTSSPKSNTKFQVIKLSQIGSTLNDSIRKSIDIVLSVGGFIILFSIISSILEQSGILFLLSKSLFPKLPVETSNAFITGVLEVTNGVNKTATVNIPLLQKLLITSALVGFGGISIHFQTLSILSKSNISFKYYILGKTTHSILSCLTTFLLLRFTKFSTLIPLITSSTPYCTSSEFSKILDSMLLFFIFVILFKIFQTILYRKKSV